MKKVIMIIINKNCSIFKNVLLNLQFNCFFIFYNFNYINKTLTTYFKK